MPIRRRKRKFPIRVDDLMSTPPIVVSRDTTIEDAAKVMNKNNIGSVIVVDPDGKVEGILTERDILYAVAEGKIGKGLPVHMIMTENPITVKPGTPLTEAINIMRENNIRHLPVVDKDNKPVGMLSLRDIVDAVIALMQIYLS